MPQHVYVFLRKVLATPFYMVLSSGVQCASYIQSSDTFVLCIYPGWFCAFLLDLSPRGPCAGESRPQGRAAGGQPLTIFGPH